MPIYEYECKKCKNTTEFIQKFSDSPMTDCGECGTKGSLEKLMSLGSFHLKGSGWYLTDYARKDKGPSENKEKSKATPKETSKETPAETSTGDSKKSQDSKDTPKT